MEDIERVEVTVQRAHEWLGYNTHNRKLRHRVVLSYAADIKAGNWRWNGESLKFAEDGTLLDGQHRLAAIIEAGVSVPMLIVRGLPAQTQETVDGGAKRKFSDILQLRGEPNYASLASAVRRVTLWEMGARASVGGNLQPTTAQLLRTLERYPELRDASKLGDHTARGCGLPPSTCSFCWWLFLQVPDVDPKDIDYFFARLHDGQNLSKGEPIYELRRTVEDGRNMRGERSITYLTAIVIKAWNFYRDGKTISLLRWRRGGATPEAFPEPH